MIENKISKKYFSNIKMDSRPVFVLITATTCPACHNFVSKVWPSLKASLEKENRVQIVNIELPDTRSKPDPVKYHKELSQFIGWFPTMSLFPADRWYNHSSDLIGIIKNGKIVPPQKNEKGQMVPSHVEPVGNINMSEEDIIKWVNYTLNNPNGFFAKDGKNQAVGNNNNLQNNLNGLNNNLHNVQNNLNGLNKLQNGKYMVPTAGSFRFEKSKVE